MLIENFRDLASHSSLHGVKFLADSRKWYQRLYWTLALLVCSAVAFHLIREDWMDWKSYPVEISEDFSPKPLSSVFIPAVTICDSSLVNKDSMFQYLNENYTSTSAIIKFCRMFMGSHNFCDFIEGEIRNFTFTHSENTNKTMLEIQKETFFNIYKDLIVPSYQFHLENDLFQEYGYSTQFITPGQKGICQSVGMLNYNYVYKNTNLAKFLMEESDYLLVSGRNVSIDSDSFNSLPILTMDTGSEDELISYPSTFSDLKGFKFKFIYNYELISNQSRWEKLDSECTIAMHSPWEVPSPFIKWQPCHFLSESKSLISYKIYYIESDSDVEDAPVTDRKCVYPHERSLQYFSYYSPKNCLFECLANKMVAECGCVAPFMPNSDNVDLCGDSVGKNCIEEMLDSHLVDHFVSENQCDCLPLCNDIDYTITDLEPALSSEKQYAQNVLEFKFQDNYINPLHRYLTDSVFKFCISTMTTLDMFLGFSVLSILELIYFLIVIVMRWVDEGRSDYREKQKIRKQSALSSASWCTVCKEIYPHVYQIRKKSAADIVSSSSKIDRDNSSAYFHEFAFLESHGFSDNCANCKKFQYFELKSQSMHLLKKEISKEIGEQLAGFVDHQSLSEIRQMIDEMRSDIHELKRRRDIWE